MRKHYGGVIGHERDSFPRVTCYGQDGRFLVEEHPLTVIVEEKPYKSARREFGVFFFCFDQDRDVRIRVFPDLEKLVVGLAGLRQVARERESSGEAQVR